MNNIIVLLLICSLFVLRYRAEEPRRCCFPESPLFEEAIENIHVDSSYELSKMLPSLSSDLAGTCKISYDMAIAAALYDYLSSIKDNKVVYISTSLNDESIMRDAKFVLEKISDCAQEHCNDPED